MSSTNGSDAYEIALANANALLKQKDDIEATIREQEALLNQVMLIYGYWDTD
jgi:hypothetical protein